MAATGTTHTGLDQVVDLLFNDTGLESNLTADELQAGAAAADGMNLIIVAAVKATGVANDGEITTSDIYTLNRYIRSHYQDSWTALYGSRDMGGSDTGFQNVHWEGATSALFDQGDGVDSVLDAIYSLGFQITNGRMQDGAADDDVAFYLNQLLAPELAAGTLANPHADPQIHGTTGTGLDALVSDIEKDPGLNDNISQQQINAGAAAADALNALIVEGIKATGIADDGTLSSIDIVDLNHWIVANHASQWKQLVGDDHNGKETGFHEVDGDGGNTYLYFEKTVDTIAEGVYDLGFSINGSNFLDQDGNWGSRVSDVSDWLTLLLQKDLADGSLASGAPPIDPATLAGDIVYKHTAAVSDNGTSGAADLGRSSSLMLQNGTIACQFLANNPSDGSYQVIFSKDASGNSAGDMTAFVQGGHVGVLVQDGTNNFWIDTGDVTIVAGRQYDFAMSFGSDGIQVYLDGEKLAAEYGIQVGLNANNHSLVLAGGDWDRSGSDPNSITDHLDGTVSGFTVYDRALTSDEVKAIGVSGQLDSVEPGAPVRDGLEPAVTAGTGLVGEVFDSNSDFSSISDLIAQTVTSTANNHFTVKEIAFGGFGDSDSLSKFFDDQATLTDGGDDTPMVDVGLHIHGYIWIGAGTHLITVRSDDGFLLSLGGNTISSYAGDRGFDTTSQQVTVTGGLYAMDLYYFQNQGGDGLRLEMDGKTVGADQFYATPEDYDAALTANGPMPAGGIPHYDGPVGTTGTPMDDLITLIGNDPGLAASIPEWQILSGAQAADVTNHLILDALNGTGLLATGLAGQLTVDDVYALNTWIRANEYAQFVTAHGDDDNGVETGYHQLQNDGGTTQLFSENAMNTVIDAIGHLCFQIVNGVFLNEDHDDNETVQTMTFWLNQILTGEAMQAAGSGPDAGLGSAQNPNVVVSSGLNSTLATGALNLTLQGTAANGTGNSLANLITGNASSNTLDGRDGDDTLVGGDGDDVLIGGTGADLMKGGNGNDSYLVDNAGDTIVESHKASGGIDTVFVSGALKQYTLGAGLENLTYTGSASFAATGNHAANEIVTAGGNDTLSGMEGNDTLDAGTGNDKLDGGAGNDWLDGGAGADTMTGGTGNDSYVVDSKNDVVIENPGEGTDTVYSSITYVLGNNLENLVLTGMANINATGNALDNHLTGNDGRNILDGGAGQDRMAGGNGNDTYYVDNTRDKVVESQNGGDDAVFTSVTYTLPNNVENGTLLGTGNLSLTGSKDDNTLTGNAGNNTLSGGEGMDRLLGGDGNDTLIGGAGADALTGGAGADTFVYNNVSDSQTGARDTIQDFSHAQGDKIDLHQIDAIAGGSDDPFHIVASFTDHAGELTITAQGSMWLVSGDVNGDGVADLSILVKSATPLVSGDFFL